MADCQAVEDSGSTDASEQSSPKTDPGLSATLLAAALPTGDFANVAVVSAACLLIYTIGQFVAPNQLARAFGWVPSELVGTPIYAFLTRSIAILHLILAILIYVMAREVRRNSLRAKFALAIGLSLMLIGAFYFAHSDLLGIAGTAVIGGISSLSGVWAFLGGIVWLRVWYKCRQEEAEKLVPKDE